MTKIEYTLYRFGVGPRYRGYRPVILAVNMILESEDRLQSISGSVYPAVAKHFSSSPEALEHNIRTIAHQAWKQDRALLEKISGCCFEKPPSAKLFIEILYIYVIRKK